MHVKVGTTGELWHKLVAGSVLDSWHRLVVRKRLGGPRTSCGVSISGFYATRDESYEGALCRDCFTAYELELNAEENAAAYQREIEETARFEREQAEAAADLRATLAEHRRRIDIVTGRQPAIVDGKPPKKEDDQ